MLVHSKLVICLQAWEETFLRPCAAKRVCRIKDKNASFRVQAVISRCTSEAKDACKPSVISLYMA
jgi:hypothetical protein